MKGRKFRNQRGFTLTEVIIAMAIAGILIALLTVNIIKFANQAYLGRANDSAEVIYMAMQSAVTDLKTQGQFDQVFSDDYLGQPYNPNAATNSNAQFYAVPDAVIDGSPGINLPGVTDAMGQPITSEEAEQLKMDNSIVYLVLNRTPDTEATHPDSELLVDLLNPYIGDKSIFNYSILVELNRSNKTVRAAFYSERTPELNYVQAVPDETLNRNSSDVYFRSRSFLDNKFQGYYGSSGAGVSDRTQKIDNAYAKIYNDDMLVVEWGEFTPAATADWAEQKKILPGMTYDVYLVNAVDTTKIYYKIEDVTPYKENSDYITYIDGGTNTVRQPEGTFNGDIHYGITRMPIYDLLSWDDVSSGVDPNLAVSSFKTLEYDGVNSSVVAKSNRLSYLPGTEYIDGTGTPGKFRLVLDSISEAGYDDSSVSSVYPKLPWDENFKVIVEGKYHGEGFTGSMTLSPEVANAYTSGKGLSTQGEVLSNSGRGAGTFAEFINYIKNRISGTPANADLWWQEISTARHLNNIRYILQDNSAATPEKQGINQNFLITGDIDWGVQKIGRTVNEDKSVLYQVVTANVAGLDLQSTDPEKLKVFVPLTTKEVVTDDGSTGFAGAFRSDLQFNKDGNRIPTGKTYYSGTADLPLYEPFTIYNLKLAQNVPVSDGNYSSSRVSPDLAADRIGLFDTVSSKGSITNVTLSGLAELGDENAGGIAGTFYGSAERLTVTSNQVESQVYEAKQASDGVWGKVDKGSVKPWDYGSASLWKGNTVAAQTNAGGLFGSIGEAAGIITPEPLVDLANGTVYFNQYEGDGPPKALNGVAVEAGTTNAGGIVGSISGKVFLQKVVNTGSISGTACVGGIAGLIEGQARLDGANTADADSEYLVTRHVSETESYMAAFQNYGAVKATGRTSDAGVYAGGIVGKVYDQYGDWSNKRGIPLLSNLRNAGFIQAENMYAGGIAGSARTAGIYNTQNAGDVYTGDSYAGGIAGAASGEARIEGAQNLKAAKKITSGSLVFNGFFMHSSFMNKEVRYGISGLHYVGGIVGIISDKAELNALGYTYGGTAVDDEFLSVGSGTPGTEIPLLVNRSTVLELINSDVGSRKEYIPLVNNAQISGYDKSGLNTYFGGIAGAVKQEGKINAYSESSVYNWPIKVSARNEGNVMAYQGSYAGGIAGAAGGYAVLLNVENGPSLTDPDAEKTAVLVSRNYAGGIVGAISSEMELSLGTGIEKQVQLTNSEMLAWDNGSTLGSVTAADYDTNRAMVWSDYGSSSGGIAGYIDTEIDVTNVFNGGSVEGASEVGGLFGTAAGRTTTQYDYETLSARLLRQTNKSYATNSGSVKAIKKAGGIAGSVKSPDVKLRDVFNSGDVKTEAKGGGIDAGDCAGGIIGYAMLDNPGTFGTDGILRYSDQVIENIVLSSDGSSQNPVYTNTGSVNAAGNYAGGIIGQGSVSLVDVFNAGQITAEDSFAGGIVGELCYGNTAGDPVVLSSTTNTVVKKMLEYAVLGYDKEFSLYHNIGNVSTEIGGNAGGIVGAADPGEDVKTTRTDIIAVKDVYNAGHVVAGMMQDTDWEQLEDTESFKDVAKSVPTYSEYCISAGGIIGYAKRAEVSYSNVSAVQLVTDQADVLSEKKLVPNMGNILAKSEAGGLIGTAAGTDQDINSVQIINGMNRGVVRSEEASAGGLLGQGIWTSIRTEEDVAQAMVESCKKQDKEAASNLLPVIAGTDQAGGIAGKLENGEITDVFNRGYIYAGKNNAGGIVGYALNSHKSSKGNTDDKTLVMNISHSQNIADIMFSNTDEGGYVFTNIANVTAGGNNAGGIAGKAEGITNESGGIHTDSNAEEKERGKVVFSDVYSGDPKTKNASKEMTITAMNNAGGMVGRLVDSVISNKNTAKTVLGAGIYTNNAVVKATKYNAGGIVGNADKRNDTSGNSSDDIREYSADPVKMKEKVEVDSNHFQVSDVYNIGNVTANTYNAGGIFGIAGAGSYNNNPELVVTAVAQNMLTNKGNITVTNGSNVGGIFGATTAKFDTNKVYAAANVNDLVDNVTEADVLDVFNGGKIKAGAGGNAGGIAGLAVNLDLRYSERTLIKAVHANDEKYMEVFLATNTAAVETKNEGAGGIIGTAYQCILQDVFNAGMPGSLTKVLEDKEYRIVVSSTYYAGGIVGHAIGLKLFYSDLITDNIRKNPDYVYSNMANISGSAYVGGIVGQAESGIEIVDAYNMGAIRASTNYAGGLVGALVQTTVRNGDVIVSEDQVNPVRPKEPDPLTPISLAANETIKRCRDKTSGDAYRGEDFITYNKAVSYITYTAISTGTDKRYMTGNTDSFNNTIYRNRYTSMPKPGITSDMDGGYQVVANSYAGGIVGHAVSTNTADASRIMKAEDAVMRIENVFTGASPTDANIGGVWAKSNTAGGIIGRSYYAHLTYSFDINSGPDGLDIGGKTDENGIPIGNSKGDHSVMAEAFNDPQVVNDPYAIDGVGLHMVPNSARVRASQFGPSSIQGNTGISVDMKTGQFADYIGRNYNSDAGGAIGSMSGGRAERLYSLKGEVVSLSNLGGVVGSAGNYALIRQASTVGPYNSDIADELKKAGEHDIFLYEPEGQKPVQVDIGGHNINAGTTLSEDPTVIKSRGSYNVGGIVGRAYTGTQILDVRNMAEVEGRVNVGGIAGQIEDYVRITLAHNTRKVTGKVNSPEDEAYKDILTETGQMTELYLDRSAVDGCYVGGIVGNVVKDSQEESTRAVLTMVKNDPLLTQNFEDRLSEKIEERMKDVRGGDETNAVDGRRFVGGITGSGGVINYAVNTGPVSGVQHIGGVSGKGYRITNSFNTADINAQNNYLYFGEETPVFSQAVFVGGVTGQLGTRNNYKLQTVEEGSYIKNCYNASTRINGASIVGGIAGYAIAPVDTIYNSARITTLQNNRGNNGLEIAESGNKAGGLVGQVAQDSAGKIKISDGYSSGIIGGTGDTGGVLGFVEYYGSGEIVGSVENQKRIENCFFIKDDKIRYLDVMAAQISTDLNATLRALNMDVNFPIGQFVSATAPSKDLNDKKVVDSEYGARNYSNMIYNEYADYRRTLDQSADDGNQNSGAGLTGLTDLQQPLNEGGNLNWQPPNTLLLQNSSSNIENMGAAKFVFPYSSTEEDQKEDIRIGRDYEFLHLDFSGTDIANEAGTPGIQLDPNTQELKNSNQWFTSKDNTIPSVRYNMWSTKEVDYMKVDVAYNDGGSAEDTLYLEDGTKKEPGTAKATLAGQVNAIGIPLWQVNYNFTGTTGLQDNHVPTSVYTPEALDLTARFSGQKTDTGYKMPRIMKFNIYDGYSRGDYSYDNSKFTVKMVENQIQKSYVLAREDEWNSNVASSSNAHPAVNREVFFDQPDGTQTKYYFYIETNVGSGNTAGITETDIMNLINVELSLQTTAEGKEEIEWKMTLPSLEMDTYLAAKSGFFTAEAVKIYDQSDNIPFDNYSSWERVSRMFSMHFASYYSSKDQTRYTGLDYEQNKGIFDVYPNLDLDAFDEGQITKEYDTGNTAALGSVKLTAKAPAGGLSPPDEDTEYEEAASNRLQIANERHLYNFNKNQNQGTSQIDSYLPYINRDVQLIRDIELSTDKDGYNCFIIGLSRGRFSRMTGSLDGMGMDGKLHTIGNFQVDMKKSRNLPNDMQSECYGLIYDLSGGVVKNLQIGADSRIKAMKVGVLAYQTSNGKSGLDIANNPWHENLGPELPMEQGSDAKIYNSRVNADISGREVGGFVYQTVRRFETSAETLSTSAKEAKDALTITNSQFGGKVNTVKGVKEEDTYLGTSYISAGFLCRMKGSYDDNNLLQSMAGGYYGLNAYVNGCDVTSDAYIYGLECASGIVGVLDNVGYSQVAEIRKSANSGTVLSRKRANGISQGHLNQSGDIVDTSSSSRVDVWYSYNNGIVETPEYSGLASGIGNAVHSIENCTNNGTVIGKIASGISSYGISNLELLQCANNGFIRGGQVAGGIVAVPALYIEDGNRVGAEPYSQSLLLLNLSDCYNTGTIVVSTDWEDTEDHKGEYSSLVDSYAGGILGVAAVYNEWFDWYDTYESDYQSNTEEEDYYRTVIRNCYNSGRVYLGAYETYSMDFRNLGGIVGGGLNNFVDIQNCYNLSDSEAAVGELATMYQTNVDLLDYTSVTPEEWKEKIKVQLPELSVEDKAYNYNLTAVGNAPYGQNVTNMPFADMLNLDNFVGFNQDDCGKELEEPVWTVDHTAESVNGYVYPFPQLIMKEGQTGEAYAGDDYQASEKMPDAVFNVNINKEKFHTDVTEAAKAILIGDVTNKHLIQANITYDQNVVTDELGAFDEADNAVSNKNPVNIIDWSRYTIGLSREAENYDVYVYDGDSDSVSYAPALIRKYEVADGVVKSGGIMRNRLTANDAVISNTGLTQIQHFNTSRGESEYVKATGSSLTISDMEELGWYMPLQGYYTVVVAERGDKGPADTPEDYNRRISQLSVNSASRGGIEAAFTADSSERFQVHFGGDSIERRQGTYASGSKDKPYQVTDQYSIIGMSTSGIVRGATDQRYYRQVSDIIVKEYALPIFTFSGNYDGAKQKGTLSIDSPQPDMNTNYTISYRTDRGEFGFISSLAPTADGVRNKFVPTVSNLNIMVNSAGENSKELGEYSKTLGRYFEAFNYTTALGLVADYAECSKIEGVTTLGNIVYKEADDTSWRDGYFNDGSAVIGGIVGIAKDSVISKVKNNATIGVEITPKTEVVNGVTIHWAEHASPKKGVHVAGIAGIAVAKDGKGSMEYVFNNGELRASAGQNAAGIARSVDGVRIQYAANGGKVRAMKGTAAGLVYSTNSVLKDSYNSGAVLAGSIKGSAAGKAAGLFWDAPADQVSGLYNAGTVQASQRGAISKGGDNANSLKGRAFYLKDEDLYWMDSSSLPPDMEIKETDESRAELYLGFAYTPMETGAFAEGNITAQKDDPFAITYDELTDPDQMKKRLFDFEGVWTIKEPVTAPLADGTLVRSYRDDEYPLPQFKHYPHLTRRHLGFPVFWGQSSEYATVPYEKEEGVVKYVPFDYKAGDTDETFKDTISVGLSDFSTTHRYHVLIYNGKPKMSEKDGRIQYDQAPALDITISRQYLDTGRMMKANARNLSDEVSVEAITNPLNKQYSEVISNEQGTYYYEVKALDASGTERPAVFKEKAFLNSDKVEILFNNDILDTLAEPGTGSDATESYYTVTVVKSQMLFENKKATDWNNYYSKFSPHFANAVAKQSDPWNYGTSDIQPYEIATMRNLNNISKGTDATFYLKGHYRQTQDIRLDSKKLDAQYGNEAASSIGVSQDGTNNASPQASQATVIKKQSVRPYMMVKSIGGNGTVNGFCGTYTAAVSTAAPPSDPDEITGGYKLIDNRRNIDVGIFGLVNEQAKISDLSYVQDPVKRDMTSVTHTTVVNTSYIVKGILANQNRGTIENVLFESPGVSNRRLELAANTVTFGLLVGSVDQVKGSSVTPTVQRIAVKDGFKILLAESDSSAWNMGSVIGSVSGNANIRKVESAANIEIPKRGADCIGMLVGLIETKDSAGVQVVVSESSATGNLTLYSSRNSIIGGLVGAVKNTDVQFENITAGNLNYNDTPTTAIISNPIDNVSGDPVVIGGIVGSVDGGHISMKAASSHLSIGAGSMAGDIVGGLVGRVGNAKSSSAKESQVEITAGSNARIVVKSSGEGSSVIGGIIGQAEGLSKVNLSDVSSGAGSRAGKYGITMEPIYHNSTDKTAGGIIGKVSGATAEVEMTDVTNGLPIDAKESLGEFNYYLGGLIGYSDGAKLYLHDTDPAGESNLINKGSISVIQSKTSKNSIYAAGGIGYLKDSPANITALRNDGNVSVAYESTVEAMLDEEAADNQNILFEKLAAIFKDMADDHGFTASAEDITEDYAENSTENFADNLTENIPEATAETIAEDKTSNVYLAGILAYAEGGLQGVIKDDAAGSLTAADALSVTESLNTGEIRDKRPIADTAGTSIAGGIIAMLEGTAGSTDAMHPVEVLYNHNAGAVEAKRSAGILTDISEALKQEIIKEESSDTIKSPVSLKWNINAGPVDAGYEEITESVDGEDVLKRIITGGDITLVYELPLAAIDGVECDGYELAASPVTLAEQGLWSLTENEATPSNAGRNTVDSRDADRNTATRSNASRKAATPSNAKRSTATPGNAVIDGTHNVTVPDSINSVKAGLRLASPGNALLKDVEPGIVYYNAALEDMVKASEFESDSEPPAIPEDRVSGVRLRLVQLQSLQMFRETTKWSDLTITDDSAGAGQAAPKWTMVEGLGPVITENRYIPPGGSSRLSEAVKFLNVETVPMTRSVRSWNMAEIEEPPDEVDEDDSGGTGDVEDSQGSGGSAEDGDSGKSEDSEGAGDSSEADKGESAGDNAEAGEGESAGDSTEAGEGESAGDNAEAGEGENAGDSAETGSSDSAGDSSKPATGEDVGDSTGVEDSKDSGDTETAHDSQPKSEKASPSDAKPDRPASSNKSDKAAKNKFRAVETVEEVETYGFELSWEYAGEIPLSPEETEAAETATSSNAEPIEAPEYEFAVIWEVDRRIVYSTQTGALAPDENAAYHFTVTPEMIAEVTGSLPFTEAFDAQISVALINDGRMYRGMSETATLEPESAESRFTNRTVLNWLAGEEIDDYPEEVQELVCYGMSRTGDPYSQALAGQGRYVDCSYFVMDSYKQLNIRLPRTAAAQAQYLEAAGMSVRDGNLEPGDLIFYSFEKNGRYRNISHVAMYVGNGMIVDASSSRKEVVYRGIFGLDSVVTCARPLEMTGAGF